jgi:hypothetical protein
MFFHLAKSRTAPEARDYVGIVGFDKDKGAYSTSYTIAKVKYNEDPTLITESEKPYWAKRAVFPKNIVPDFTMRVRNIYE